MIIDGVQAFSAFRVTGSGIMRKAIRMGNDCKHLEIQFYMDDLMIIRIRRFSEP